jgi:predicted MFS family arabinose efflux permease
MLAAGLLLLGLPAFVYAVAGGMPGVVAITLARGVGFGVVTVVFVGLIVELAPSGRRGEALGLLGVAITVPTIFANSLGIWMSDRFGYEAVFALGAILPLLGLGAVFGIRGATPPARAGSAGDGFFAGLRRGPLLRLLVLFCATTMASGVIVTFLPLAAPGTGVFSAAGALLVVGVVTTVSRWWAGRFGDRHDARLLLAPGLIACAAGTAIMPWGGLVMISGATIFGAGFGLIQNASLVLTMQRVSKSEYGLGSTLWNAAFDAGTGLGAFAFGFVVQALGFSWAFILCAALVASALSLVYQDYVDATEPGA